MRVLRYTLVADGSSDRSLMPIINWCIAERLKGSGLGFVGNMPDFRFSTLSDRSLTARIRRGLEEFPCDLLFVHRDAERRPMSERQTEIASAAIEVGLGACVPIVPVRMTEAWLLVDELAIRTAAGNPNGSVALALPRLSELERLANPKQLLRECLVRASEAKGRRLDRFRRDIGRSTMRVAELISDYSLLLELSAFSEFVLKTQAALNELSR